MSGQIFVPANAGIDFDTPMPSNYLNLFELGGSNEIFGEGRCGLLWNVGTLCPGKGDTGQRIR
jgi:hypothetical protein